MADPTPFTAKPLAWWSVIQAQANRGANVTQMWEAIRGYTEQYNLKPPPGGARWLSPLWHSAVGLREASRQVMSSPAGSAVTSDMIGQLPYGRPSTSQSVIQTYLGRVGYGVLVGDQVETRYVAIPWTGSTLPSTVDEIRAQAEEAAIGFSDKYAYDYVGVFSIQIGAF